MTGVALSLLAWALAAWIGRVPWPLGSDRGFEPARAASGFVEWPAPYVVGLVAAAIVALVASAWLRDRLPSSPQAIASRIGYPGLVMATGLGWLRAARPVGERQFQQSLSRALSPGASVARHACAHARRVPAPAPRPGALLDAVDRRSRGERHPARHRLDRDEHARDRRHGRHRRRGGRAALEHAAAHLGGRTPVAHHRRGVVLLPARRPAGEAPRDARRVGGLAAALRVAARSAWSSC